MKISVVTGQTATGKTGLSLLKAASDNGDIINFDSRQIYKHLDIITGKDFQKPNFQSVEKISSFDIGHYTMLYHDVPVRIWLYDILDPGAYFSSFDYAACAMRVLTHLEKSGRNAVITGGSFLYLYHLLYEVETQNIPPDFALRARLDKASVQKLQEELGSISPDVLKQLNGSERNNPQRLIRKIEIAGHYRKKGETMPLTMQYRFNGFFKDREVDFTGLAFKTRDGALETVRTRVENRLDGGAVDEVEALLAAGYSQNDPGMKTIGYRQIIRYLKGDISKEEAIKQWIISEMQYTKRQYTFMKKDPHIKWRFV